MKEVDIKENTMDMKCGNSAGAASSHNDRKQECTDCSCGFTHHNKEVCKNKDIPWLIQKNQKYSNTSQDKEVKDEINKLMPIL